MKTNNQTKKPSLTEEEKKAKFGDKYDPNYKNKSGKRNTDAAPKRNDGHIYIINDQIGKQVANLPYNKLPGLQYPVPVDTVSVASTVGTITHSSRNATVGTVMAITYWPYFGMNTKAADGLNVAARQLYSYVRHANSGARNYEAPDIMMYVAALSDIYGEFFELRRALGIPKWYELRNRAIPQAVMQALDIDATAISQNANYTAQLNILAAKINSLAVPKYFDIFLRRAFLSSKLFLDSNSIRGQIYAFKRGGYYTWSGKTSTTGTELKFQTISSSANSMLQRLARLTAMVDALLEDEDAAIISGDILKAFGEGNLYSLLNIPSDFVVEFSMDEDVLAQIENMMLLPSYGIQLTSATTISAMNVTQEDQLIKSGIKIDLSNVPAGFLGTNNTWRQAVLLNSHKEDPDYVDNMEWTRLLPIMYPTEVNGGAAPSEYGVFGGLELPISLTMYYPGGSTTLNSNNVGSSISSPYTYMLLEEFDWHPTMYADTSFASGAVTIPGADVKVWTWITSDVLAQMHQLANEAVVWDQDLYKRAK